MSTAWRPPPHNPPTANGRRLAYIAERVASRLHGNLVFALAAVYILGAFAPSFGLPRQGAAGSLSLQLPISPVTALLAILLFNSGVACNATAIAGVVRAPKSLIGGWIASILLSVLLAMAAVAISCGMRTPSSDLFLGMAIVFAMPMANSAMGWIQNGSGNVPLGLGLLVGTTLASPPIVSLVLHLQALTAEAGHASQSPPSIWFGVVVAVLSIAFPTLLGVGFGAFLGQPRVARLRTFFVLSNVACLLLINYLNASAALPPLVAAPTETPWLAAVAVAFGASFALFALAGLASRAVPGERAERLAAIYALGMKNTGAALVLAGVVFGERPIVALPIMCCTLMQHVFAGISNQLICRHRRVRRHISPTRHDNKPHTMSKRES